MTKATVELAVPVVRHRADVLIAGASRATHDVIGAVLRAEGHVLLAADDLDAARAVMVRQPPGMLILELAGRAREGRALVRALTSAAATAHIPVLLLHAGAGRRARLAGLVAGAAAVITRLDAAALRLQVRNLMRGSGGPAHGQARQPGGQPGASTQSADGAPQHVSQRSLRESERRFLELLNNTSMLAVMLDLDARITFCNAALLRLMGLPREEVVGGNWFEVFMASDPGHSKKLFLARLADGSGEQRYEDETVNLNGERRVIRWNTSVLHDIGGAVIGTTSIGEDITEQKHSAQKILNLNANLEKISSQLLHAQEQERISLARELHDELGQRLALLKIDLHHLRGFLHADAALAQWRAIDAAVVTLIAQIRVISVSLRPPALDYLGLEAALRQLLERQFASGTCTWVFEYAGLPPKLAPSIDIALYRIVQESINNIVRHARATSVVVELNGGESGRELELLVRDNGIGFLPGAGLRGGQADGSGNGVRGMEERVRLLGGRFDLVSSGAGTCIAVALSLGAA